MSVRKRVSCLSAFPMIVPSLSWQNDHFWYKMASQKMRFFTFASGAMKE
jgi:hypothetical protein